MRKKKHFKFWVPRVLALFLGFFILLFYLGDIYITYSKWPLLFNYFLSIAILAVTLAFWKNGKWGGLACLSLAVVYIGLARDRFLYLSIFAMTICLVLLAVLFMLEAYERELAREIRKVRSSFKIFDRRMRRNYAYFRRRLVPKIPAYSRYLVLRFSHKKVPIQSFRYLRGSVAAYDRKPDRYQQKQ